MDYSLWLGSDENESSILRFHDDLSYGGPEVSAKLLFFYRLLITGFLCEAYMAVRLLMPYA